ARGRLHAPDLAPHRPVVRRRSGPSRHLDRPGPRPERGRARTRQHRGSGSPASAPRADRGRGPPPPDAAPAGSAPLAHPQPPAAHPPGPATAVRHLPPPRYPKPEQLVPFYRELLSRLASQPGVRSAAAVTPLPFSGNVWTTGIFDAGRPEPPKGERLSAHYFA